MTREELLRKLEARLEETLDRLGIEATVVSLSSTGWFSGGGFGDSVLSSGAVPLSLRGAGKEALSEEVLEVVRETVRQFVVEHGADFVRHFGGTRDPRTLN